MGPLQVGELLLPPLFEDYDLKWMLRLKFVRKLGKQPGRICLAAVSEATADIVLVAEADGGGSRVWVETVNGSGVGAIDVGAPVTALALTSLPEGTAVNCLAAGFPDGTVRLWNMWNLAPVPTSHLLSLFPVPSSHQSCLRVS